MMFDVQPSSASADRPDSARPDADVIVVGAGIAGLAAAHDLTARGLSTIVVERDDHVGGRIQTEHKPGMYLEHGGIFHTHGYTAMRRLLDELGLADKVIATAGGFRSAVRHSDGSGGDGFDGGGELDGKGGVDGGGAAGWSHVDYGSLTGPLRFGALSWGDRLSILRAAVPALLARPSDLGDLTTLARLDTRSAAEGLTDRAATYFTAGPHEFLWGTATRTLSYAMLAMQLHVFKGQLRELKGGIGQLTDALAAGLDVRTSTGVERVETRDGDGVLVHLADRPEPLRARAAVLACPADVAAAIWPDAPAAVREHLTSVEYSRIDYVYLRTRRPLERDDDGRPVGIEVITSPEVRGTTMGGIYYANDWADEGGLLLVTAAPCAHAEDLDDDELADRLQADAERLHPELAGDVTERIVIRHHPYTPTFGPGSVRRLAAAREHLPAGRIDLAGDHMTAPWVEGAVRSGQLAAGRIAGVL
jgi:monoamine oxidase